MTAALRIAGLLAVALALGVSGPGCVDRREGQDWIGYGAPTDDDVTPPGDDDTDGDDDSSEADDDTGDDDTGDDDSGDDDTGGGDLDQDADGFTPNQGDCDDHNPLAYPGGVELCDGADNNCDGHTDEANAIGCVDYHLDADGDGYGDPTHPAVCLCAPQAPYEVTNMQDCYDGNGDVYPGQAAYFEVDRGDGSYDYDCDTLEYHQWTGTFVCGLGCTPTAGWYGQEPACGAQAIWGTSCHWDWVVFDCVDDTEQRIQPCH